MRVAVAVTVGDMVLGLKLVHLCAACCSGAAHLMHFGVSLEV